MNSPVRTVRSTAADRLDGPGPLAIRSRPAGVRIWVKPPEAASGASNPASPSLPVTDAIASALARSPASAVRRSSAWRAGVHEEAERPEDEGDARRRSQRDPDAQRQVH
jgi:hypothetical protein